MNRSNRTSIFSDRIKLIVLDNPPGPPAQNFPFQIKPAYKLRAILYCFVEREEMDDTSVKENLNLTLYWRKINASFQLHGSSVAVLKCKY